MIGEILDLMSNVPEVYDKKEAFMSQMEELRPDLMYPESWDDAKVDLANNVINKTSVVKQMFSAIPMRCLGDKCPMRLSCPLYKQGIPPVGERCHPPGTLINTVKHGMIPIEELDPCIHSLYGFERKKQIIRNKHKRGYSFNVSSKEYCGFMVKVQAGNDSHEVTHDHISIARFNENATGKFCVYIMRAGSFWRIGKSKMVTETKESKHGHKTYLSFPMRGNMEEADGMWILGVYDTNTEALLAEEEFSLKFQVSKVSFSHSLKKYNSKHNGLYKWATEEQIREHHEKLRKPESFYRELLFNHGLDINYPIWESGNRFKSDKETSLYVRWPMFIRACNIIPGIMDVPVMSDPANKTLGGSRGEWQTDWVEVSITKRPYHGKVYALDVEEHKTYFAENIATHNCPIELRLIRDLSQALGESLAIDYDDFTEISQLRVIVNQEIQLMRAANYIAEEGFIMENVVGMSDDGEAVLKKEMSLAVELEDKIHKRLKDYRAQLLATRIDRAKVNQGEVDSAKAVAKILKEVAVLNAEKERKLNLEIGSVLEEDIIDIESME